MNKQDIQIIEQKLKIPMLLFARMKQGKNVSEYFVQAAIQELLDTWEMIQGFEEKDNFEYLIRH